MNHGKKYLTVTDDNFRQEVLESSEPVLLDFWADWCGPCHMVAPIIEELAGEYQGKAKIGKLDVDRNPAVAQQYGIRSIPTLLFFKDGEVVDQAIGAVPRHELTDRLDRVLGNGVTES